MADAARNLTAWRQGSVLVADSAVRLSLVPQGDDQALVVVISHDCDIASAADKEPMVELIVGRRIERLGADTHAKTARRLHLPFDGDAGPMAVELLATQRAALPKAAVLADSPRQGWSLSPDNLVTLQNWLAARYRRAAFPEAFEARLKAKPGQLHKKIAKAMDEAGVHVLAVFFDLDEGQDLERQQPDDAYQLRIHLLYDSSVDEPTAYAATQAAATTIEDAFEAAFCQPDGAWRNIRLLSCEAVSDSAMTVATSRLLKQWRLDYMSLEADPQQPMLADGRT